MSKLKPGQCYARRRPDIVPIQLSLEREAVDLLRAYVGPGRLQGRFVSRLIYEHRAREEARAEERAKGTQASEQALVAGSAAEAETDNAG